MSTERVVVLRALGLGDLLTAVPALRALRRARPAAHITLLTPAVLAPLAYATGAVDAVVPASGLQDALPEFLAEPDVAVNLHGSGPESTRLLQALRPRSLVAFECAASDVEGPAWDPQEHEVLRLCRLLSGAGCQADPLDLLIDVPPGLSAVAGATLLHPGAKSRSRRWPVDRWIAVAAAETVAGREVVVTGSEEERGLVEQVARRKGGGSHRTVVGADILEFAGHVAAAGRVVCGDTGVAHLATALGRPSVLLFGPMSPALWGPIRDLDRHVVLWAGRHGDPLGDEPDPGLLAITAADVVAAIDGVAA